MKTRRTSFRELLLSLLGSILLLGYLSGERLDRASSESKPERSESADASGADTVQQSTAMPLNVDDNENSLSSVTPPPLPQAPSRLDTPYSIKAMELSLFNFLPEAPPRVVPGSDEHYQWAKTKSREVYFQRTQLGEVSEPEERLQEKNAQPENPYRKARNSDLARELTDAERGPKDSLEFSRAGKLTTYLNAAKN